MNQNFLLKKLFILLKNIIKLKDMAKIRVTLVKSTIGQVAAVKGTVAALGLKKIRSSKELDDTPVTQGMIAKVKHLVKVENV